MSDSKSKGKMLIIALVLVVIIAFVVILLVNRGDDEAAPAENTNGQGETSEPEEVTQESIVAELAALETRIDAAIETATALSGEFEALIEAGCGDDFSNESVTDVVSRLGPVQEEAVEFGNELNAIGDKAQAEPDVEFEKIDVSAIQTKIQTLGEQVTGLDDQNETLAELSNTCNSETGS